MAAILGDLHHAARRLARAPGFAALAIFTLALGIGAHTAVFGWVDAVFLRPLPVPGADRLVGVYETRDRAGFFPLSLPDHAHYRERARAVSGLAAHYPVAPLVLSQADGGQQEVLGSVVSPGYFPVLGLQPERGRFFQPEEGAGSGGRPVAVVSYRFWRSRLGGREDVLGSVVRLNDTPFTVVGVAPEGFRGVRLGSPPELWIPTSMASVGYRWCDTSSRDCTWVEMIGRLAPGRTLEEARTEMTVLARRRAATYPAEDGPVRGLAVEPLRGSHPAARPRMVRLARLLVAAVTLALLVAAANVGGLLVARNLARRHELATRLAIGASRWRVVHESLAETVLVASAAGAVGLGMAAFLARVLAVLHPSEAPIDVGLPPVVLGYAAMLSLVTGVGVGLATGIQASRPGLAADLRERAGLGGRRRPRVLGLLVVVQVAVSFVLLAATGLLARSLDSATRMGGVEPETVATLRLRPRLIGYGPEQARTVTREAVRRLAAMPGVESVTVGRALPPWSGLDAAPGEPLVVEVGAGFFETFGFPIVRGRPVEERDGPGAPRVAVVNRALAETRWPGRSPLGEILVVEDAVLQVVGVVDDTVYRSLEQVSPPLAYTAYWQDPTLVDARIAVRTSGDAGELLATVLGAVRAVDSAVPSVEAETLAVRLDRLLGPVHVAERVLAASTALAVLLSAIGLYGVLALAVAQQRRDIGIRMALGGSRGRVVFQAARGVVGLVVLALGCGVVAALLGGRGLSHHLYGVSPSDPLTLAAALAAFVPVAILAGWWPARRAARTDPAVVLRQQ